jgi:hypothetical protein
MTSINITQLTATKSNGAEVLSIDSPEVIKALSAACQGEAKVHQLWLKAANTVHRAGVTYMMLTKEGLVKPVWDKLESIVINSQSANEIVLFNSKTIELNSTQRAERKNVIDHVRICMGRIAQHLKKLEDIAKNGVSTAKSLGESMAKQVQELIDKMQRAKADKIDFPFMPALQLLKSAKAEFMKPLPSLTTKDSE